MPTLKELREKRPPLVQRMREMVTQAEGRVFSADEEENWKAVNKEYDDLTGQVDEQVKIQQRTDRLQELEDESRKIVNDNGLRSQNYDPRDNDLSDRHGDGDHGDRNGRGKPNAEEDRTLAIQSWLRCGSDDGIEDLSDEQRNACKRLGVNPARKKYNLPLWTSDQVLGAQRHLRAAHPERRALSVVTGSAGAHTIPPGFVNNLETALLAFGGMSVVSTLIRTAEGSDLPWPTANDTAQKGVRIGENTTVAEQDITFKQVIFKAYKYSSKMIKVPTELLHDSAFNLATWLGERLAERLGRITNQENTTGTGASQPKGIMTAATLGVTTASTSAIDWLEIDDLIHSVNPAYRGQPGVGFMMHDNIVLHLRKIVDGNGRTMWMPDPNGVPPSTLKGFTYTINQDMSSSVGTTNKTLLFGLLSKYHIRTVQSLRLVRLDERYADTDQVAFLAWLRQDGNLVDAGTNPVKYLQQT